MLETVFYSTVLYHIDNVNSVNNESLFLYSTLLYY